MNEASGHRQLGEVARVGWRDLRPHAARGALFLVSQLDLVEAATAVAEDDTTAVQKWLSEGKLARPTADQHQAWEAEPDRPFDYLIVQPFVLARPLEM